MSTINNEIDWKNDSQEVCDKKTSSQLIQLYFKEKFALIKKLSQDKKNEVNQK